MRGLFEQQLEIRFGLSQFIVGFFLQAIAASGFNGSIAVTFILIGPLLLCWSIFLDEFDYTVVCRTIEAWSGATITYERMRKHFSDIPERTWQRAIINNDFKFAEPG